MGEAQEWLFEPTFNRSIKVRQKDQRLTSDAGVLLLREADHRLGLVESLAQRMTDPRHPDRIRYSLIELLRERLYALAQGYRAEDDLDRLAHDPALKMAVWDRRGTRVLDERLASQPTQSRLLDTVAVFGQNRQAMREALADWLVRYVRSTGPDRTVRQGTVDMDGFPIEVHGEQPGGAYNGYYQTTVYSSLVASFSVCGELRQRFSRRAAGKRLRACPVAARDGRLRRRCFAIHQGSRPQVRVVGVCARPTLGRGLYPRLGDGLSDRAQAGVFSAVCRAIRSWTGWPSRISNGRRGGRRRKATKMYSSWACTKPSLGNIHNVCCWWSSINRTR